MICFVTNDAPILLYNKIPDSDNNLENRLVRNLTWILKCIIL